MSLNNKYLDCLRKSRTLRANFEKLLVNVSCNNIHVMTAGEFRIIDILTGHPRPIRCLSVSQISKAIVSYSQELLIVHTMVKEADVQGDYTIHCGQIKWEEHWRVQVQLPIMNLTLSPLGDYLALSGESFFSVWIRDIGSLQSFSNFLFYSKEENKNIVASIINKMPLGDVVQQEITQDGRLIIILEDGKKSLKIWYQNKVLEPAPIKKEQKKVETKSVSSTRYREDEKTTISLDFNPYADYTPVSQEQQDRQASADPRLYKDDLCLYELPQHRNPIEHFKILQHDIYESEKKYLANVILTISKTNEVFMWYENLANSEMQFNCAHIFKGHPKAPYFDVSFLDFPPVNPKRYYEIRSTVSKLFDTSKDQVLKLKKEDNRFGIYQKNYHETSYDWILLLDNDNMQIFKVEGLRNYPIKCLKVEPHNTLKLPYNPRQFYGACRIFSASCRDFNDTISLYYLNSSFQIMKIRKSFKEQGKWKLDKVSIVQKDIKAIEVHQQLPLVAYHMMNDEIIFFIEENNSKQIVRDKALKFIGAYSYHQSTANNAAGLNENIHIKSVKWVQELAQLFVHFSDNTVALLSSRTMLKILAHNKYPDEYLKLWSEKRSVIGEKWVKLVEVSLEKIGQNDTEEIIGFDILGTKVSEGSFINNLVIFTSHQQYYLYSIETKFLEKLRTLSTTTLVSKTSTEGQILRILGSTVTYDTVPRTEIIVISEIDPKAVQVVPQQESESEDEDDGDIFAQFTKSSVKKKKPIQKAVEAPQKYQLLLKLIQFEHSDSQKKYLKEAWKVEIPELFKNKEIICKMDNNYVGLLVNDDGKEKTDKILYIYEIATTRSVGFVNMSDLIQIPTNNVPLDFIFPKNQQQGGLIVFCRDTIYMLAQDPRKDDHGRWSVLHEFNKIFRLELNEIQKVNMFETPYNRVALIINNKYTVIKKQFTVKLNKIPVENNNQYDGEYQEAQEIDIQKVRQTIYTIYQNSQKSFALFDPKLLLGLFVKGYINLVIRILVQLLDKLKNITTNSASKLSEYLDMGIDEIANEITNQIKALDQQATKPAKKETANSMFDDFYAFEEPSAQSEAAKANEVEESDDKKLEQQFEEGYKSFIDDLTAKGKVALQMNDVELDSLIVFVMKFKILYKKDFFADKVTSFLMRQLFFETEEIKMEAKKEETKALDMKKFLESLKAQPASSKGNLGLLKSWSSFKCALALYSENQDVIFTELSERFDFEQNLTYDLMKRLTLPLWLKDISKLKQLVEKIAKVEYRQQGDDFAKQSKAERTALWYILLGKKNILATLYKAEPQNKKVYELLLNDFNEPKWKTTAEKNAMVLMSRKNNLLACAFFVLAGNIVSALQVALGRLNDPILGILICRLTEGEDSENLKSLYQEFFITRGQKHNDPFMVSIGRWGRKEYVMALNSFQLDANKYRRLDHLLKSDDDKQSLLQVQGNVSQETEIVPGVSQNNYFVMDVVRAVKKAPAVKRELNKSWALDSGSGGGGGSIFDDFFGGPSQSSAKQEEKKKDEKANLDEGQVMQISIFDSLQHGFALMALIVVNENVEFLEKMDDKYKVKIAQSLLKDITNSLASNPNSVQNMDKVNQGIDLLAKQLEINSLPLKHFIFQQSLLIDSLQLQVAYLGDNKKEIMFRLEDQAVRILDFVYSIVDFPFITEYRREQKNVSSKIIGIMDLLEHLVEGLIIADLQIPNQQEKTTAANKPLVQQKSRVSFTIADSEHEDKNYSISIDENKGTLTVQDNDTANKLLGANIFGLSPEIDASIQNLSTKMRISLIIYMALIQVSFITRKFTIVKETLEKLKSLFQNSVQQNNKTDLNKMLDINYQSLKIQIQKFRQQINQKTQDQQQIDGQQNKLMNDFEIIDTKDSKTPANKKSKDNSGEDAKYSEFAILWMRYLIIDNLYKTMEKSYKQSTIQNLVNIRPTIINNRMHHDAVATILDPKLKSSEILKKMHSMARILENVTTYYFEKLLNVPQRSVISHELRHDGVNAQSLGLLSIFKSEKEYEKFTKYIDMKACLGQLRDHELSLTYHTNLDYSNVTVDKTKDLLQSGIDLIRMKGEQVNGFAFDRCGRDLVALALLNKGIREIPVQSTLLYRSRINQGLQIMDEECQTWGECLHRYDPIQRQDPNLRPSYEPVIAAIDKLYSYKTISYAKKATRTAETTFKNYEISPPSYWNGQKSSDYYKASFGNDINHEDYSYAVESHPFLPLYVTGNSKGLLCLWNYGQREDKSLDQWVTETDLKNANPKKATIKKIQFSNYGEKMACINMEGSFFVYRVDTSDQSKMAPIFSIKKTKEQKFNDFEFLNNDSVFAMGSLKPKHTWIFDTLVPQRGGLVMENAIGGNIIQAYKPKSQIFTFNERPGQLNVLDLKMNKVLSTQMIHTDEVTAVALNQTEDTLIAGFRDGVIKIFNIEKDFEVRESNLTFQSVSNKKGTVSQIRIHPTNGALFASSQTGNFKLFRTRV